MAIKLIGIDLDGTLLTSEKKVTREAVAALQAAADHGIQVVISTGRFLSEFADLVRALPMMRYTVTCTGAEVLDLQTGESLARHAISDGELRRIYGKLRDLDAMVQIFSGRDGRIHNRAADLCRAERFCGPALAPMVRRTHAAEADLDAFVSAYSGGTNKIHIFFPDRSPKDTALSRLAGEPYALMESVENDLEIMAPGVDKGLGLRELAEHLGLDRSQVMAIGDSGNDVGMLRYAGTGVAMGNASREALEAAGQITDTNDRNGVALAVRTLLKQEGYQC